jgi:Tfp pilus assembly protein PilN
MPLFALGLFAVTLALWLVDRRRARRRALGTQILAVVVVAVAVLATGWTIRTGHTGSEMVWQGIYPA